MPERTYRRSNISPSPKAPARAEAAAELPATGGPKLLRTPGTDISADVLHPILSAIAINRSGIELGGTLRRWW